MGELRHYQESGADWLAGRKRGYLGDEPGLGKTRTLLAAAAQARAATVHVICPAVVVPHWHAEHGALGARFELRVISYQGLQDDRKRAAFLAGAHEVLILDEGHYLKHASADRTKDILSPEDHRGLAHDFTHVWPASGTPMPRNPAELFPILAALWPHELVKIGVRTYEQYLTRFCHWKRDAYGGVRVSSAKNAPQLAELLRRVMLRRLTIDVEPDLPALRWGVLTVQAEDLAAVPDVDPQTRAILQRGELPDFSGMYAVYRHAVGDLKAPLAADLVRDELANDRNTKRVVFAYHHSVLNILERLLKDAHPVRLDGTKNGAERADAVWRFQHDPHTRVFLGQTHACGVGLDGLQYGASDAILVEPDPSGDVNVQAGKRVNRIGSTRPGSVRMLALAGTLDTWIVRNHFNEARMRQEILDAKLETEVEAKAEEAPRAA